MMALFKKIPTFCAAALAALCFVLPATGWAALTDNGNGTVTDTETALIWDRCSLGLSGATCATGTATTYTWGQALDEVTARNASNHLGFNDWRLPNFKELESIVDLAPATAPAIDVTAFPNTPSNLFWSSTTYAPIPAGAWIVYFYNGDTSASLKTNSDHVRLVRSGQSFASFDALASPALGAQTLTFGAAPSGVIVGDAPTVNATSASPNSGNAIGYGSATAAVCSVNSSSGVVTTLAVGTCTITADQAGDAAYSAAPQVTQSFSVGQAAQTITFPAQTPASQTFVASGTFAINPLATGGASGNAVTYSSITTSTCTVSGTTVTIVAVGTCTIAANQAGNTNYAAATQVTQNVAIGVTAQTITFPAQTPASQTFAASGTFPINPTASGGASGNPVTYSSLTTSICTVSGTTVTIVAVGTCTIAANQAGNTNYAAAAQVTQNVAIGLAAQTLTFGAAPAGAVAGGMPTVAATSASPNSGNAIVYSTTTPAVCAVNSSTGVVTALTVGTCTIAVNQAGSANYAAASQATQSFSVGQAAQTVTFTSTIPTGVTPGSTITLTAGGNGANSGNPITYTSATPTVCTVNATTGVVTALTAGTCTIVASQAGNGSFAAGQTTLTFNVTAAPAEAIAQPVPTLSGLALAALALLMAGLGAVRRRR